ncbi:hypothetical protein O181_008211 [Austropuccinia psidii MF-1]|uniref:Uncharacterized protein n=1 Tax=Austropuccinia psidii MF-1 TaxID=1389203 RepID=A0A9Q3BM67_9BASI|nr:hypothetical protein [Austropuccinia psidii MF-1]
MKIQMRNHKLLTQLPGELYNEVKFMCSKSCTLDDIYDTFQYVSKTTDIEKFSPYKGNTVREKQSFRAENSKKTREKVTEVTKRENSCHNYGSKYYYYSCPKAKKKIYSIEQVPEEEIQAEDSESYSMGDSIRENSDDDKTQ